MTNVPETLDLLDRLVAFNTVSDRPNLPLAQYVADLVAGTGARVHWQRPGPVGKANLIAFLGPTGADSAGPERPGLVLSGHMDVVPANEDGWASPPFRLTRRNGRAYGRGAADMKGFLAVALRLILRLDAAALGAPLVLLLTCDEETGTEGSRSLAQGWEPPEPLPQAVVVGEPTGLRPVTAHKGHVTMRVTIEGVSAHSGYPHLGRSAIEPAGALLLALTRLRRELEQERWPTSDRFPDVPYPALNVGTIRGGSAVNVVPDLCVVDIGLRLLPGMDGNEAAARIERAAGEALGAVPHRFENLGVSPPMLTPPGASIGTALERIAGGPEGSVAFATDAGWFQQMGLECVVWGPGSIEVAHKPNEYVEIDDLQRAEVMLEALVDSFCGGAA